MIEPEHDLMAIGSGGAVRAGRGARAARRTPTSTRATIVEKALGIAADICIYTNRNLTIETLAR